MLSSGHIYKEREKLLANRRNYSKNPLTSRRGTAKIRVPVFDDIYVSNTAQDLEI